MKTRSTCPKCPAVLEFDRALFTTIKCPKCAYTGNVAEFKELEATEINPGAGKFYKPGKLELIKTDAQWLAKDKIVNLQRGENTLGRKSPNSSAKIQFPTDDRFMSKLHATIDVIMKPDGAFEHRLSDNGSKNGTFHNSDRLEKDDVIKLMPNDKIKLGHSLFKLIPE